MENKDIIKKLEERIELLEKSRVITIRQVDRLFHELEELRAEVTKNDKQVYDVALGATG